MNVNELKQTITTIAQPGKGILAADESTPTILKRFQAINLESTEETRQAYREMLFTTPGLHEFVSGVILYEETLLQKTKGGIPFPRLLIEHEIIPGIKVDAGTIDLTNAPGDKITQGLDGLNERLIEYKKHGAKFAKWRAVLPITAKNPQPLAIEMNAINLARYAAICQQQNIVPIVEPELLMDGDHTLERCQETSNAALHTVFHQLHQHKVLFEYMILKPSMVISGAACPEQANIAEVAEATLMVLRDNVPASVPTINFLSGGQSTELATAHLNAMNASSTPKPWLVSFSYGRALQAPALQAWQGKTENVTAAQQQLYKRAKLNSAACLGKYNENMEKE